jgi:hypothetical protein
MECPWKFYEKSVGMWVIESNRGVHSFPLQTKSLDMESVAREYFHYFDEAMLALEGLFTVTSVEYPPGEALVYSAVPLDIFMAKQKLFDAWREDVRHCGLWAPGAVFRGLSEVSVQANDKVSIAQLPGVIGVMFSGVPGSDRYALALATNCDIWLERTISGGANPVGRANAIRLERALKKLEDMLDGKVSHYATELEGVHVTPYGFA